MRDHMYEESKGKKAIEFLIEENGINVWIPALATDVRILNNDKELVRVKEIRVIEIENLVLDPNISF